ncbi:MAG: hypothetical protein IJ867_00125 [Clostridia bacterium]|nr:hypothetical protein [Clostridia bacterium]
MAKKVFLTIIFSIVFVLGLTTISFAKTDNTTTGLGDEVTSSMNKTERSMNDLVDRTDLDKAGQTIENGARAVGNAVSDGMDNIGRGVEDFVDGDDNTEYTNRATNTAVAGTTGNYTAGQLGQTGTDTTGRNGMTANAWIWIVMVVVALIIVAAVWYYAAQRD